MIGSFHFLRPWWLVLALAGPLLLWLWHRRADPRAQWQTLIAPHLLDALVVGGGDRRWWRPIDMIAAALVLGAVAVAGPTWRKEPPPFGDDAAPMMIAIDLSQTMDATDVAPTRLERVKQKVRDLLQQRPGARTGLVVYAGTAHLVVPPAEDPAVLEIYLPALATGLMPVAGKNAAAALALAEQQLAGEAGAHGAGADAPTPPPPPAGTILFFTDGMERAQIAAFEEQRARSRHQVLVLGVGTAAGGPLKSADGGVVTDASGRPLQARLDKASLEALASEAGIPVASVTTDASDVAWVERRAQHHLEAVADTQVERRWHESGYWLTLPLVLLAALWFRRGWVVEWSRGLAVVLLLGAAPARAADSRVVDLFLTPDQQGRWHFERDDYAAAAAHFADPLWKGIAAARAGDQHAALQSFARLDTPEAFFLMGNCYARLGDLPRAMAAYDNALAKRAAFPEAAANRKLVADLLAKQKDDDEEASDPNLKPDDVEFDDKGKRGKTGQVDAPLPAEQAAEVWMRNLKVSPADFLRQKFQIQAAGATPASGGTP